MKKQNPVFLIGGLLVSIIAIVIIINIGTAFATTINNNALIIPFVLLSAVVFILIQYFVVRQKFQTLKNYYLMAGVISLCLLLLLIRFFLALGQKLIIRLLPLFEGELGGILAGVVIYTMNALCIFVFIMIFTLITKGKSNYIRYISDEVKKIAENGEDIHIEEKGNDELTILCRSINQMNADLQKNREKQRIAENQKNELISNVSHDLRSPLTSIMGYVQLLKEYGEKDSDKFREYIEVTDRRLNDLNRLINELFELTKMDSPNFRMNLTDGNVTAFIKQFGYKMSAILSQNSLNIMCAIDDNDFFTKVDFERLARVFQNLFANVIKYAVPDTDVLLESKVYKNKICICLSNTLAEDADINTEMIFDRFYRDDQARTDSDSAGLGLAIAKKIVELHGGDISAAIDGCIITIKICLYRND